MPLVDGLRRLAAAGQKRYRPGVAHGFNAGDPVWTDWDTQRAVQQGLKASTWVYRCVSMIMESGSTVPLGLQRKGRTGQWEFDWNADESKLLGDWNDDFSAQESLSQCIAYLLLGGNMLVAKFVGLGRVREIRAETPVHVRPVPNLFGGIEFYEAWRNGIRAEWLPKEIIHGRLVDPENPYWGLSRLKAIAKAVDTDVQQQALNKGRLERGGVPDGLLIDPSISNPTQRREAQKEVDDLWQHISGAFVTGSDVDWIQLGLSQQDLQWLEGRRMTMREIVMGFGFHPALFGEDASYHNSQTAERAKWTGAILPILNVIASAFTRGLIPREKRGELRIGYDVSGVEALREDLDANVKTMAAAIAAGVPIDAAKDLVGLPLADLPDGLGKQPLVADSLSPLKFKLDPSLVAPELQGGNEVDEEGEPVAGGKPKPGAKPAAEEEKPPKDEQAA